MGQSITWVAIDDHKQELVAAVLKGRGKDPQITRLLNEDRALRRWVRRLDREAGGGEIRMCYEAGPNGFALKRRLESMGPVVCEVIAPTLTPRRSGTRVKTDPRDAGKLVKLFRAGELTEIGVPEKGDEAARDLTRLHHRVSREKLRKQHHILKFLTRRGRIYPECNWTLKHRRWIADQQWEHEADQIAFDELLSGLRELEARLTRLEKALGDLAREESRACVVSVLRCFYGIDTVAAVTLSAEIFDIARFPQARQLMSYLGSTTSVSQSGFREVRGGITKAGNSYARWILVRIAWHYSRPVKVGAGLRKRREGQPTWAIEIADRAHHRLHRRFVRLRSRGKPTQKVVMAVAREFTGFVWEAHARGTPSRTRARRTGRLTTMRRADQARSGVPRLNYAIGSAHGCSELANLDWGTSSTDHGHAVSAREDQTDSSSKRPDLLSTPLKEQSDPVEDP